MSQSRPYLYERIAESLRRRIASGDLTPGDRLTSVRDMAREWSCTPGTVSRAYGLLADEGLILAHQGSGTRVARGSLQTGTPLWQWASLVNRAEHYLLEALGSGHSAAEAQSALSVASARWEALQDEETIAQAEAPQAANGYTLQFVGSHDLLIEILSGLFTEAFSEYKLETSFPGSLGGLMALAGGDAAVAGIHLWDVATDSYNEPFVRRVLPGRRLGLITLAERSLGLITAPGNPRGLEGVSDLARAGVRFVNRQPGSGTRVWLDAQLQRLDVNVGAIRGYEREATTHTGLARSVADGDADVGLGIYAAAAAFNLGFVGLAQERYDLVMGQSAWESEPGRALRQLIGSERFLERTRALGGYSTTETGRETVLP